MLYSISMWNIVFTFMLNVTQFSFKVVHHLIFYCNEIGQECIRYSKEE